MPKYKYKCDDCDQELVVFHSIKDKFRECPVCGVTDSLIRVPGEFVSNLEGARGGRTGALVREKIEEFKEDLDRQKKSAKEEVYE